MKKASDFEVTSFEKLFQNAGEFLAPKTDSVQEIPIAQLHPFKDHPFRVTDDEKMEELTASIRDQGILVPGICRKDPDGGYEIIAGHRRVHAAGLAGLTAVPMRIVDYDDCEATQVMVDTNIQREDILPSEKAKAYRMKYDRLRADRNGIKGRSVEELGRQAGESGKTVQRYLWLSRLDEGLLEMVDSGRIGFIPGVDISFLKEEEQQWVLSILAGTKINVSKAMASRLKEESGQKLLSPTEVAAILTEKNTKNKPLTIKRDKLKDYFDDDWSDDEILDLFQEFLEERQRRLAAEALKQEKHRRREKGGKDNAISDKQRESDG